MFSWFSYGVCMHNRAHVVPAYTAGILVHKQSISFHNISAHTTPIPVPRPPDGICLTTSLHEGTRSASITPINAAQS